VTNTGAFTFSNPGPNHYSVTVNSSGGTGSSFGLSVLGGSNTGDSSLLISNSTGSIPQFAITGDGSVNVGTPAGGLKGLGSVNAQALYVNGIPLGPGSSNAAILAFEFFDEDQWPQGVGTNYPSGALNVNGPISYNPTLSTGTSVPTIGTNKPGSAVTLGPVTWETVVLNGTTFFRPLWQ
jgi:hypothetical protein